MPGRKQYAFGSALEDKDRNQSRTCAKNDKGRRCYPLWASDHNLTEDMRNIWENKSRWNENKIENIVEKDSNVI